MEIRSVGKMICLQYVHTIPAKGVAKLKQARLCKCLERDRIGSVEEMVNQDTMQIIPEKSVIWDKETNTLHPTWHSVDDIINALAGTERSGVGFKPQHNADNIQR